MPVQSPDTPPEEELDDVVDPEEPDEPEDPDEPLLDEEDDEVLVPDDPEDPDEPLLEDDEEEEAPASFVLPELPPNTGPEEPLLPLLPVRPVLPPSASSPTVITASLPFAQAKKRRAMPAVETAETNARMGCT